MIVNGDRSFSTQLEINAMGNYHALPPFRHAKYEHTRSSPCLASSGETTVGGLQDTYRKRFELGDGENTQNRKSRDVP
jgi:hypothetical protein